MRYLLSVFSINILYMFRALFVQHQEVLYVQQLVYFCAYYVGPIILIYYDARSTKH
jgi:hypothetical protein